jgi:hypothetical protein
MATTNYERVGKALDLLRAGLEPFVERECSSKFGKYWITSVSQGWERELSWPEGTERPNLDAAPLLRIMWEQWNTVFRDTLGPAERGLVGELRGVRNN